MNNMALEEYKGVFVFAQQVDNVLDGVAFELLGKGKDLAKDLGTDVTAVLIGSGVKGLADQLAEYGADKVIVRSMTITGIPASSHSVSTVSHPVDTIGSMMI